MSLPPSGPNVAGVLSSVSGHIVTVAKGMIAIDVSAAKIVDTAGDKVELASLTPGSTISATVKSDGLAANAPIPATQIVVVATIATVSLTGRLTAIDAAHNTFTILGKTLRSTPQTVFYGPGWDSKPPALADIQPNQLAVVVATPKGQSLVADSVILTSERPDPKLIHGRVKSIAPDAWVIGDQTFLMWEGATKIYGDPKVGDMVDVTTLPDNAGKLVALSIAKSKPH